ncbi:ATP-binding domain-containing protein [Streptomyces sp. PSKA54]|uniref:ATP-binding domain-containing protein n=2 Tax=Streptomyces TaxID=1883 RepID=A0A7W2HIG7_9ACTN|nr:ATP-binding domain-containing protein [Streptomyces himalayensis subsp. aureolus]
MGTEPGSSAGVPGNPEGVAGGPGAGGAGAVGVGARTDGPGTAADSGAASAGAGAAARVGGPGAPGAGGPPEGAAGARGGGHSDGEAEPSEERAARPGADTAAPAQPAARGDGEAESPAEAGAAEDGATAAGGHDRTPAADRSGSGAGGDETEKHTPAGETAGGAGADGDAAVDPEGGAGRSGDEGSGVGGEMSDAEAELAAQRALRERIEKRKAEKQGPVTAGAKLTGKAADLLAAVRAVESGERPVAHVFDEPEPAPRKPVKEPVRRPTPTAAAPPASAAATSPETVEAVREVLTAGGAPAALAVPATAALGDGAAAQLRDDPWQLLRIAGVRPEQTDGFARALLGAECGPDDERRGRAITVWLLEQAALAGHTALDADELRAALAQRSVPDPDAAVQNAIADGDVLVFQDALDASPSTAALPPSGEGEVQEDADGERPVRVLIGLERCALAEESLADGLARVINSLVKADETDVAAWERAAGAASRSAAELIRAVAGHGLVLHTGGEAARAEPSALVAAARAMGLRVCAATHSPDGRRRLAALLAAAEGSAAAGAETAGVAAERGEPTDAVATVAGLLSGAEGPGRDADGALAVDLLVVLDAPQLDVETAAMVVESLPDGARLVLSGDPSVLWPAGAGRVFGDLLAARVCPQIASRMPDTGPIGELVSGIGIGELNEVAAPGKEVVIVPVRDPGEAVHRTVQLVADSVPRAIGVPSEHTQVITPGHGGAAGTRALNTALKERLNPGPGRFGGFDPGDRVAYSPALGRTVPGRVVKADADGLHLDCEGTPVVVPKEQVERLVRHGWALTAHQAVGQRWPAAVVVLPGDAAQALTRAWVYTAFGRADRHLSVVQGADQALPRAVAEIPAKPRTTRLQTLMRMQVPAGG